MSYYPRGRRDGDYVDDFDEFDPTPYGGGYDITLTYGRPLQQSEEICYSKTSSSSAGFDYDRPQYASHANTSAYGDEALNNEYNSYTRPKPRPGRSHAIRPEEGFGAGGYDRPQANYGFQPGGFGGEDEFGKPGHGRRAEHERPSSDYGSGYGKKTDHDEPSLVHGSGYGRRPESEVPSSDGYGRTNDHKSSEYGGSGFGRKSEYEKSSSEYGSGFCRRTETDAPSSENGSGYGKKVTSHREEEGGGYGHGGRYHRTEYEAPSHGRPRYGRSEEEDFRKPSYERHDGDKGYGRKKYDDDDDDDDDSDDDDDEKKKHRRHSHRKHYDD